MLRNRSLWRAPQLWPRGECFILGGGPSLKKIDLNLLKGRRVIAVNNAYNLGDWDVMFFGDCRWFIYHKEALLNFAGLKITTCQQHINQPGIKVIKRTNSPQGISRDPGIVRWNLSSGGCALNVATHFGVKRIILLGFDMRVVDDKFNWHEDHPKQTNLRFNPYPRFLRPFPLIADDLKKLNIECLNATEGSALDAFPKVSLEEVL